MPKIVQYKNNYFVLNNKIYIWYFRSELIQVINLRTHRYLTLSLYISFGQTSNRLSKKNYVSH